MPIIPNYGTFSETELQAPLTEKKKADETQALLTKLNMERLKVNVNTLFSKNHSSGQNTSKAHNLDMGPNSHAMQYRPGNK